ncbi:MAG: hypothetical protein H0W89_01710 [Candidatus Levybacteria bacterium]|nr:hypothetical protein [Candidatus Levybacteria bacterium]
MREHENNPQVVFYDIIERLTPASNDSAGIARNDAGVKKLQADYNRIKSDELDDLPRVLMVQLKDNTQGDMSEVVAHALKNPKTLQSMSESNQRELMQLALENDIASLQRLPNAADIFPKPIHSKLLPKLVRRQEMLADLKHSTPQADEVQKPTIPKNTIIQNPLQQ